MLANGSLSCGFSQCICHIVLIAGLGLTGGMGIWSMVSTPACASDVPTQPDGGVPGNRVGGGTRLSLF